jgi:hypothetical protein
VGIGLIEAIVRIGAVTAATAGSIGHVGNVRRFRREPTSRLSENDITGAEATLGARVVQLLTFGERHRTGLTRKVAAVVSMCHRVIGTGRTRLNRA